MIIAQLTDPHIKRGRRTAYGRVDTAALFEAAVDHVNRLAPKADAALVTGDLTDTGTLEEYGEVRPILDRLECPYFVIPGNHDDAATMRQAFGDHDYMPEGGDFLHYAIDAYPVRLVGLDSTVPGQPGGLLCADRLEWLDACLSAQPDAPSLLFMHHPPFETGIGHMDVQNLANAGEFIRLLSRHSQVRHVACGHVHRAIDTVIGGVAISIGPNAAHSVSLDVADGAPSSFTMEPPMMRLFHWIDGQVVTHLSFVGGFDGPHPFFKSDGSLID